MLFFYEKKKPNIWRKYFKIYYRAHLDYLVEYVANYVYRVWIFVGSPPSVAAASSMVSVRWR
jgi:hypothetical protein